MSGAWVVMWHVQTDTLESSSSVKCCEYAWKSILQGKLGGGVLRCWQRGRLAKAGRCRFCQISVIGLDYANFMEFSVDLDACSWKGLFFQTIWISKNHLNFKNILKGAYSSLRREWMVFIGILFNSTLGIHLNQFRPNLRTIRTIKCVKMNCIMRAKGRSDRFNSVRWIFFMLIIFVSSCFSFHLNSPEMKS